MSGLQNKLCNNLKVSFSIKKTLFAQYFDLKQIRRAKHNSSASLVSLLASLVHLGEL